MKFILHIVIFAVGAGAGVVWGVHHPQAAQNVDLRIQKEVSQAKVELLNKFISENPKSAASYQQMATDAQKKLDDANQQLNSQQ